EVDRDAEGPAVADLVVAVDPRLEADLGDEVLVVVEDLPRLARLRMVADDREAGLEVAELDARIDAAHPREQRVREAAAVPLGGIERQLVDRRRDQRRLRRVEDRALVDRREVG